MDPGRHGLRSVVFLYFVSSVLEVKVFGLNPLLIKPDENHLSQLLFSDRLGLKRLVSLAANRGRSLICQKR